MRVLVIFYLAAVVSASPAGYDYQPASADGGLSDDGLETRSGKDSEDSESETFAIDLRSGAASDSEELNNEAAASGANLETTALEANAADESNAYENTAASDPEPEQIYESTSETDTPALAAEPGIDKEFYTFEANEEDFNDPAANAQISEQLRQSLRVVFVKGPEQSILDDAAAALAKQSADQNTDIYVLDKQADIDALTDSLNALGSIKNNKPKVSFVKYRTSEDAGNAIAAIEAEFESQGGTTQSHDGGVAPTLNFASKQPVDSYGDLPAAPAAEYLPASIFRF